MQYGGIEKIWNHDSHVKAPVPLFKNNGTLSIPPSAKGTTTM